MNNIKFLQVVMIVLLIPSTSLAEEANNYRPKLSQLSFDQPFDMTLEKQGFTPQHKAEEQRHSLKNENTYSEKLRIVNFQSGLNKLTKESSHLNRPNKQKAITSPSQIPTK